MKPQASKRRIGVYTEDPGEARYGSSKEIEVLECTWYTDLYLKFSDKIKAQDAYLIFHPPTGRVMADPNPNINDSPPEGVFGDDTIIWQIPLLTGDGANRLMHDLIPLLERVKEGWSNGHLDEDAQEASDEISMACAEAGDHYELLTYMMGNHYFKYLNPHITADTTDEEITQISNRANDEAIASGLVKGLFGMREDLMDYRDKLRERQGHSAANWKMNKKGLPVISPAKYYQDEPIPVTVNTTDEELRAIIESEKKSFEYRGFYPQGLGRFLRNYRDKLRKEVQGKRGYKAHFRYGTSKKTKEELVDLDVATYYAGKPIPVTVYTTDEDLKRIVELETKSLGKMGYRPKGIMKYLKNFRTKLRKEVREMGKKASTSGWTYTNAPENQVTRRGSISLDELAGSKKRSSRKIHRRASVDVDLYEDIYGNCYMIGSDGVCVDILEPTITPKEFLKNAQTWEEWAPAYEKKRADWHGMLLDEWRDKIEGKCLSPNSLHLSMYKDGKLENPTRSHEDDPKVLFKKSFSKGPVSVDLYEDSGETLYVIGSDGVCVADVGRAGTPFREDAEKWNEWASSFEKEQAFDRDMTIAEWRNMVAEACEHPGTNHIATYANGKIFLTGEDVGYAGQEYLGSDYRGWTSWY